MAGSKTAGRRPNPKSDEGRPVESGTPPVLNGTPRLRFGDRVWTDADLDVTWRVNAVEALAGSSQVDPAGSSLALVSWLALLVSEATDTPVMDVMVVLQQMRYSELRACLVR